MPPGDTKTRRGMFDAILCGCIPVLFDYPDSPDPANPMEQYHWHFNSEEIQHGFVYFNEKDRAYMKQLAKISEDEIKRKIGVLRRLAFRIQYSVPKGASDRELPGVRNVMDAWSTSPALGDDAVSVILNKMFERTQKLYDL